MSIFGTIKTDYGQVVGVQHPFSVDGDSVYQKDIDTSRSTSTGWTGDITSPFTGLYTEIYNDSATSPKVLYIAFKRTLYCHSIGLGNSASGTFSNVKIELIGSDGTVRLTEDDSANNTAYGTNLYPFSPTACIAIRISFVTTNRVGISNCTIQKEVTTVTRLQALKPDGTITDIDATAGGNLKVSIEELESGISVNDNSQLRVTNFTSNGDEILPATEAKQDAQIVLETTLNAIQTIIKNTITTNDKTHLLLQQIRDAIAMRPDYVDASNAQNVVGSVSISSGTVTTVTTLTGQTNIGGFSADMMTENNSYQDWGLSIRSLII